MEKLGQCLGNRKRPQFIAEFESQIWNAVFRMAMGQDVLDAIAQLKSWWTEKKPAIEQDNESMYWWRHVDCKSPSICAMNLLSSYTPTITKAPEIGSNTKERVRTKPKRTSRKKISRQPNTSPADSPLPNPAHTTSTSSSSTTTQRQRIAPSHNDRVVESSNTSKPYIVEEYDTEGEDEDETSTAEEDLTEESHRNEFKTFMTTTLRYGLDGVDKSEWEKIRTIIDRSVSHPPRQPRPSDNTPPMSMSSQITANYQALNSKCENNLPD